MNKHEETTKIINDLQSLGYKIDPDDAVHISLLRLAQVMAKEIKSLKDGGHGS